jgi:hypothetical protein
LPLKFGGRIRAVETHDCVASILDPNSAPKTVTVFLTKRRNVKDETTNFI